jgi:Phosphotransferase enzyme family
MGMGSAGWGEGDGALGSGGAPDAPDTSVTEEAAWSALRIAGDRAGLGVAGARLWRSGSGALVFGLGDGLVTARVSPVESGLPVARRAVAVARWLESVNFPAVRLVPGVQQPVVAESCVVTFWRLGSQRERPAELGATAELLRRLHWLVEPASLGLELLDPLSETRQYIRSNPALSDDDREFLLARTEALARRYEQLDFVLPRGMVHGTVSIGNVLLDDGGNAVLVDVDGFAVGPREWDLAATALSFQRLGWRPL